MLVSMVWVLPGRKPWRQVFLWRGSYDINLKKSSSPEQKGWWHWKLVCSIGCSSTTKFVQIMTLGWPWPILRQGQIWSCMLLSGKKVKQWIFQKLLSSMIWQMTEVTRSFCWHQNFVPWGLFAPLRRGYIHVLNHEKKCIKSDLIAVYILFWSFEISDNILRNQK